MQISSTTPVVFSDKLARMIVLLGWSHDAIAGHARRVLAASGEDVAGFDIAIDTVPLMAIVADDGCVEVELCSPEWEGAIRDPAGEPDDDDD